MARRSINAIKNLGATGVADPLRPPYNSPIPAFNLLANAFDLLMNDDKLGTLLENISQEERDFLYSHPLLKFFDLLP